MASRTWVGGGNDNAGNADHWSPTGVPQPGDTLDMQGGTMNIRDDDLAGDTLRIGKVNTDAAPTTLNLSHHAKVSLETSQYSTDPVTVNVTGTDTLRVQTGFPGGVGLTINLADHASLTGAFLLVFSTGEVDGGAGSRFVNDDASQIAGSEFTFNTAVRGNGTFTVGTAQSRPGDLEFGDSVSRGQGVTISGDPGCGVVSHLRIDDPDDFKGSVALQVFGEVDLKGLTNADSYQLKNDILSIYSGCDVIEKLRLTTPAYSGTPYAVAVTQQSTGLVISRGGPVEGGGAVLPPHVDVLAATV